MESISTRESQTIRELVAEDYRKAEVFKKYDLDFCCGGNKTISQACEENHVDLEQLTRELDEIEQTTQNPSQNFNKWNLDFLIDFIVNTHHVYVAGNIPVIHEYAQKVASRHGENHPEVVEIASKFNDVANELRMHMAKEENILFPYIKQLVEAKEENQTGMQPPPFGSIQNPIQMMEAEHDVAGNVLKSIAELSDQYTPPAGACTTFQLLYAKLEEFENDLHQHVHLENNILFPKAIMLEEELLG